MRVVVYVHHMEIGGSQLGALELARETMARGPRRARARPSGRALWEVADRFGLDTGDPADPPDLAVAPEHGAGGLGGAPARADVVHAYEWGPAIDVALGPHLLLGTPPW